MSWINVTDRLPKPNINVLASYRNYTGKAAYIVDSVNEDGNWGSDPQWSDAPRIDRWQPIEDGE
tara:strand:- start:360 stop:551 length:192 start_codon:yes stop_codon:yes gene_type:complete